MTKRDSTIDTMKAIGIILMVLGHSGFKYTRWIYQFHMAMFFIIAGYCYNRKYSDNRDGMKELIKKRIKSLYVPCLLYNLSIVLLHNTFIRLNFIGGDVYSNKKIIISIIKCFLFSGGESLSGAMWFLRTMFLSTIVYATIDYIAKLNFPKRTKEFKWGVSIILLLVSWISNFTSTGKFLNVFSVIILFQIGFAAKEKTQNKNYSAIQNLAFIVIGFAAITIPMLFEKECISLNINHIINPVYFIWCSIFGTLMCYGISNIISKSKKFTYIQLIGQNTLPIVMFHFAAMKIITAVQILYYKKEIKLLAAHPILYKGAPWTLLYTVVGVLLPLLIDYAYKIAKDKILKIYYRKKMMN